MQIARLGHVVGAGVQGVAAGYMKIQTGGSGGDGRHPAAGLIGGWSVK